MRIEALADDIDSIQIASSGHTYLKIDFSINEVQTYDLVRQILEYYGDEKVLEWVKELED